MEAALEDMTRQGAEVVDPVDIPPGGELGDAEHQVLLYEFKADLNKYLAGVGAHRAGADAEGL